MQANFNINNGVAGTAIITGANVVAAAEKTSHLLQKQQSIKITDKSKTDNRNSSLGQMLQVKRENQQRESSNTVLGKGSAALQDTNGNPNMVQGGQTTSNLYNILAQNRPQFILKNLLCLPISKQHQQTKKQQMNQFMVKIGDKNWAPTKIQLALQKILMPALIVQPSIQLQNLQQINQPNVPQFYSEKPNYKNGRTTDTSMSHLDESSVSSQPMPHIEIPKRRKNLNEVASLYLSSDEDDDESYGGTGTGWRFGGGGNKSMMSNYSNRIEKMKLNLLSRFRASKGMMSPQNDQYPRLSQTKEINTKEFTLDNNESYRLGGMIGTVLSGGGIDSEQYELDLKYKVKQKKKLNFSQRISEQAIYDYYRNYKNLKASIERDEHMIYPQSAYISSCEKSNLVPRPYGLVTYKGDGDQLNVQNFLMGNNYAKAYSKGLQLLDTKQINISNNRLNEQGTIAVLKGLNKKAVEDIDISHNKLGVEGLQYLAEILVKGSDGFNLRILKLEQTHISDHGLIILIQALDSASDLNKSYLKELNLACNMITCAGAEKMANYIGKNPTSLKVLNLHWNKIKFKGGLKIAEALQNNSNLKVLDLSWNALGKTNVTFAGQLTVGEVKKKLKGQGTFQNQQEAIQQLSDIERIELETVIGRAWGKALGYNKYLVHLDLSHNSFGVDSCRVMQKKIKKNHTLYGLHLAGNSCRVDSHGFIIILTDDQFQSDRPQTSALGGQILDSSFKKNSTIGSIQQKSQSRQQKQRSIKKSMPDVIIKSPQKDVLFKRMEGVKAVIKKRNLSYGAGYSPQINQNQRLNNNSGMGNYDQLQPESPMPQNRKVLGEQAQYNMQSQASISQPGAALQKYKVKDNCWICEGWSEFRFDLRVPQHVGAEVQLHFDFDDFAPDLMVQTSAGVYTTWRMVPPGTHHYFMSVNGSEYFTSGQQYNKIDEKQISHIDNKLQKTFADKYMKTFNLHRLNFVESLFQQDHIQAITPRELHQQQLQQQQIRNSSSPGRNQTELSMQYGSQQSGSKQSQYQRNQNNTNGSQTVMANYDLKNQSPLIGSHHKNSTLIQNTLSGGGQIEGNNNQNEQSLQNGNVQQLSQQLSQQIQLVESYAISRIKNCLPRPDKSFLITKQERPRTPWTFPISLFREYKPEVPQLVNDCFEFDWGCLRKPKLKKSTEEEMKEKCREMYPFIREIYKRLSALGIVGTVFSIGWNVYREFMIQSLNLTEKEKLKPDDCDRLFIGVNAGNQRKAPFIPQNGLVRFQFLEIIMKAAIKRYFESGDVESELDALDMIVKNNFNQLKEITDNSSPYFFNQHKWRVERYWNEGCDNIFKAFAPLLTYIYNTFGGSHKKPGQKTFMTLDEFDILIQTAGMVNDLLNQRDIVLHFNYAMMCQVNEIDLERHLQATYIEYLEAFARACDQASIVIYQPPSKTDPDQQDTTQDYIMTEEERQMLPLHIKIENAIQYLIKNCCPQKGFLDKFEMPKKHPLIGLYILPNKKFF